MSFKSDRQRRAAFARMNNRMRFVVGKYKKFPSSKHVIVREDVLIDKQTPKQAVEQVASIHGYKVVGYKTKTMTEDEFRRKYKIFPYDDIGGKV